MSNRELILENLEYIEPNTPDEIKGLSDEGLSYLESCIQQSYYQTIGINTCKTWELFWSAEERERKANAYLKNIPLYSLYYDLEKKEIKEERVYPHGAEREIVSNVRAKYASAVTYSTRDLDDCREALVQFLKRYGEGPLYPMRMTKKELFSSEPDELLPLCLLGYSTNEKEFFGEYNYLGREYEMGIGNPSPGPLGVVGRDREHCVRIINQYLKYAL